MNEKFKCESIRLSRYLYSLGFDKESVFVNGSENWLFEKTPELQECLDFYFNFRHKQKFIKGVNENASKDK